MKKKDRTEREGGGEEMHKSFERERREMEYCIRSAKKDKASKK